MRSEQKNGAETSRLLLKRLYWERIYLRFELAPAEGGRIAQPGPFVFYIADAATGKCCGELTEDLTFNCTNAGDDACLPAGDYRIAVCDERDGFLYYLTFSEELKTAGQIPADPLDSLTRRFSYHKNCYYQVGVQADEKGFLTLRIREYTGKKTARTRLSDVKKQMLRAAFKSYRKKALKERGKKEAGGTILFLSEESETPGPNLTAVRDRMKERGMFQKGMTDDPDTNHENGRKDPGNTTDKNTKIRNMPVAEKYICMESARSIRTVKYSMKSDLALVKKLAEADCIVADDHIPMLDWLKLDPKQKFIQLWHAGVGFKATGYARWGHKGAVGPFSSHRQITYATVSSCKIREIFSELWGISPARVLPCGIPRMDALLDPEKRKAAAKRVQETYPALKDKKVVLFAPTYRGKGKRDAHYPMEKLDLAALYQSACEQDFAVLFQMHPWIRERDFVPEQYRDRLVEALPGESINALFSVSDLLITDYSSAIFEFASLQRPMLFYAFDEETYAKDRGFHRPYRENAPGKVVSDFESLLAALRDKDFEAEKVDSYVERHFDTIDASSCDRVIDWLIEEKIPKPYLMELTQDRARRKRRAQLRFPI